MYKIIYCLLFLILVRHPSLSQTTFVPDTSLRKVLVNKFPGYLDANHYIIDSKAATYGGVVDCSGKQVLDLTGIWKFTGMASLLCQNNSISHLDSLEKLTNLSSLFCFQNRIKKLPDLSTLNKLFYLSCGSNQISGVLDLSRNLPLNYLDISNNQISDIKGMEKLVNLQTLISFDNPLDTIGDLSALTKLQVLMCHRNRLNDIPGLTKLTQLTVLLAGENKLNSFPDISHLTRLNRLMLWDCQLTAMPDVSKMTNLNHLILSKNKIPQVETLGTNAFLSTLELDHNHITQIPDLSKSKGALKILKLHHNFLEALPDFSLFAMDTFFVDHNRLTFEDIIPLISNKNNKHIRYAPQDSLGIQKHEMVTELASFKISLGIDRDLKSNQYTWYKNGKVLTRTPTDTLEILQVQLGDSGTYHCEVSNTEAPDLRLYSRPVHLKVKQCINISHLTLSTTDYDCNLGGKIKIDEASISGGQKPYTYQLTSLERGTVRLATGNIFTDLFEKNYLLEVRDRQGCKAYYNNIALKGKSGTECKSLLILGDENSPHSSLYLEERGTARIYDSEGQLVQDLNTPTVWDGKNKNGEFLPGYYVIELNGKTMNVTLIK